MALNTTPEEAVAIHELAVIPAREIASKWMRSAEYRNTRQRFPEAIKAALAVVEAGVSIPALEVNKFLADSFSDMNSRSSQYSHVCAEVEAEILGYAIEAHDAETLALFREVSASQVKECPECGETSNDFRGDWCKDCDKEAGA